MSERGAGISARSWRILANYSGRTYCRSASFWAHAGCYVAWRRNRLRAGTVEKCHTQRYSQLYGLLAPQERAQSSREITMTIDERRSNVGRRSGKDRRSGVDTRTEDDKRAVGDRRSPIDRRSGLDRRSTAAAKLGRPKLSRPNPCARFSELPGALLITRSVRLLRPQG